MSERGTVSDQLFPRDIVERITNGLLFILQQPLYHPWICWEHEQCHGKIYCLCTAFIWLFTCWISCFFLLTAVPWLSLPLSSPPSFGSVASHTANTEQGRNMDCRMHSAFRKLKGWHTAFTITAVRQRKCEENVYTQWELPGIVLSCADGEGATDGHPWYPSGCCWNRYLHAHLQDRQTHRALLTPCSVPGGTLVLQNNRFFLFLQVKMYYKLKSKTKWNKTQSSLCIFSSAKHIGYSQINYNLSSKKLDLANFFYKAFPFRPLQKLASHSPVNSPN